MTKNLVIVESPAKARTIERYLGDDYRVLASYGHVRDLPENPGKNKLGVDVEHDFAPDYEISEDRRKQVSAIERAAGSATTVYLATDLDREGEAIAWHVVEAADIPLSKTQRVTFSEITEGAIREAFAHPRQIDMHLVDAQQARRVLDRVVGYTLSPLLWRKVRGGLSAGRVQSVAVRLVVDREREIGRFVAREYWTLEALLETTVGDRFTAALNTIDGAKAEVADAETAQNHTLALKAAEPVIDSIAKRTTRRNPAPPFTTSTLQQEASRKLSFNPRRTMRAAQHLYEGLKTDEGQVGLITYMRTDSTAMASVASNDELRLYRLIWQRAIASQMAPKEMETTTVDLVAGRYGLRATATRTVFEGFARVYTEGRDDESEEKEAQLPPLREGEKTRVEDVTPTQHFTEPPPRYTEATLIKALEENGIGRPSTYAATISTILDRGYVVLKERRLFPETVGEIVTDLLVEHFGEFVDLQFTARMESDLDDVASGKRQWVPLLREFYGPFKTLVDAKRSELKRSDFTTEETDEVCSQGHPMVIRLGRNGRFLACSTYPEHKETRPLPGDEPADLPPMAGVGEVCPLCGEGTLAARRGRFGAFVGCSRYPDCSYIKKDGPPPPEQLPFEVECPKCGQGHLAARRARRTGTVFWGCSRYPKCDFTTSREPLGAVHDADAGPVARSGETGICLRCGADVPLPATVEVGMKLPGGPPNPGALAPRRPARGGAGPSAGRRRAVASSAGSDGAGTPGPAKAAGTTKPKATKPATPAKAVKPAGAAGTRPRATKGPARPPRANAA